ncbi:MAG TPA: helix-turn-helix domain-containing protein [Mycobacteriales bacterium]|nr:helix-turn-helix domain-containing protein [Mycobacteriales bacterium]
MRETVARALTDLRHEGLLGGDHRRIVIPDPARLRAHLTSVARHPTRRSDQSRSNRDDGHTLDDGGH